jgi:LPS-assembly lipoprotein
VWNVVLNKLTLLGTLLSLLVALNACGFRLRGNVELPSILQDTYIQSEAPFTGMARALRTELQRSGANVLETKEQASAILTVVRERSESRVLSVGSTGKATEYQLFDEAVFSLSDASGKVLIKPQTVRTTRDLVFDPNELLGKLSEADNMHRQMRESLARQILIRIDVGMRQQ